MVERDIERLNERGGKREEMESEKNPYNMEGSINGPSNRGRVGLTLKLDELL